VAAINTAKKQNEHYEMTTKYVSHFVIDSTPIESSSGLQRIQRAWRWLNRSRNM